MKKRVKIPSTVLTRAKAALEARPSQKPVEESPKNEPPRANAARAKVVAALKKLHPMD